MQYRFAFDFGTLSTFPLLMLNTAHESADRVVLGAEKSFIFVARVCDSNYLLDVYFHFVDKLSRPCKLNCSITIGKKCFKLKF